MEHDVDEAFQGLVPVVRARITSIPLNLGSGLLTLPETGLRNHAVACCASSVQLIPQRTVECPWAQQFGGFAPLAP
jgi:hypothetical protein